MQKQILQNKNRIAFGSGILILLAFFIHLVLKRTEVAELFLIVASIIGILPIAIQAYQALRVKVVSIDVLVTVAVAGAFLIQNYEESAIVTFLFLFGGYLEQRTLTKTRSAIQELVALAPERALLEFADGETEEVDVDDVDIGDILIVKTGDKVPVDGKVLTGEGHVNEASITGEPLPAKKMKGAQVFAGTILENGTLRVEAERIGEDTTFGRIIELVEEAQDSKSEAERFIDSFSKYYTPAVLLISLIVYLFTKNLELAITILVLGCPGALVIGVPVSNVAGIGNGARHGILLKGSEVIHDFSRVDTILFDKTGTLTEGNPSVSDVTLLTEDDALLPALVSVERESSHPLAQAIVRHFPDVKQAPVTDTHVVQGGGVVATVDGRHMAVGNAFLMDSEKVELSSDACDKIHALERKGHSIVLVAIDGTLGAILGIRDAIRPGMKEKLQELKQLGVKHLIMLSGDNQGTVDIVKEELGLTEGYGNLLPEDKAAFTKKLVAEGRMVAFVGDGINDSPSLATAQVGIAMGGGTDVAIETSDVVLMNSDMGRLPHALGLAKATARNMKQNMVIAIGVVLVLMASLIFSDWMNMSIGMFVHEGSILAVILNGMRLLGYKK